MAGVVKKLSEENLEDKAKRITDKLENAPEEALVEKEKKVATKKPAAKKATKEDKLAAKKTTKK
ncbi:MAG: hypothetical protein WCH65_08230 [bacterium]